MSVCDRCGDDVADGYPLDTLMDDDWVCADCLEPSDWVRDVYEAV